MKLGQQAEAEVRAEQAGPGVHVLVIDRPARRNALNLAIKNAIADLIEELDSDQSVRVIVISGGPDVFAAGTDVEEMTGLTPTEHTLKSTDRMFTAIRGCRTPVIAAVEGYALGEAASSR